MAAAMFAPAEIPINTPSFLPTNLAYLNASSSETVITLSTISLSYMDGIKLAPIPCILCAPAIP